MCVGGSNAISYTGLWIAKLQHGKSKYVSRGNNRPYSVKMTSGISAAMATIVPCIYCLPYRKVCFQI